ncbi:Pam16 [Giardia duodenalis]|uniref:Pam16 n=1 Tax=Giardia intestinalis (strain ATCC 50803 / WB clone C6) TaxID=184922 RepID=A8BWL2_GIAIC|nr:Pam16 [Giardia intestinalis]KAE8304072.1 Pam16 [Giardia intestinalis]|eukprot:XP_001704436.1 Hypothetical protein GL50803_19230 [Giardia lamblia ATCC 50803]
MLLPKAGVEIAKGLTAGVRSSLSVLADNIVESSLALADIWHHVRAEVRSLAKAPNWAKVRIAPMPLSQASQILDIESDTSLDKIRAQRDKLLGQLSLSPFLQVKVNEAYERIKKSKCGRYAHRRESRRERCRESKIQILNKNI